METTDTIQFETHWTSFIAMVKGKLINAADKQPLSTALANLILTDAAFSWESVYDLNGKWLDGLKEREPEKGEKIDEILFTEMKFSEIKIVQPLPRWYNLVIPAIGAFAGLVISSHYEVAKWVQWTSTLVPAALLYSAVNTFRKNRSNTAKDKTVAGYISQLDKYKQDILSLLA